MAFVDLEKAFDRVPRKVLWWALCVVGVPEWLVKVLQAMYVGARNRAHVNSFLSEEFELKVKIYVIEADKMKLFLLSSNLEFTIKKESYFIIII